MKHRDIINSYKFRILSAQNKELETEKVIQEITNNSTALSDSDKSSILSSLLEELNRHYFENFSLDNKEYLKLIEKAIMLVSEKQE